MNRWVDHKGGREVTVDGDQAVMKRTIRYVTRIYAVRYEVRYRLRGDIAQCKREVQAPAHNTVLAVTEHAGVIFANTTGLHDAPPRALTTNAAERYGGRILPLPIIATWTKGKMILEDNEQTQNF
jgi:hypothetical protein